MWTTNIQPVKLTKLAVNHVSCQIRASVQDITPYRTQTQTYISSITRHSSMFLTMRCWADTRLSQSDSGGTLLLTGGSSSPCIFPCSRL